MRMRALSSPKEELDDKSWQEIKAIVLEALDKLIHSEKLRVLLLRLTLRRG